MRGFPLTVSLVLILLGSGLFGGIADNVINNGSIVRLDLEVSQSLPPQQVGPPLKTVLLLISLAGSELIFVASLPLAAYLIRRQRVSECAMLLLAVGGGETTNLLLKVLFSRQKTSLARLPAALANYMFPSGHAMVAFIFYGIVTYWIVCRIASWHWRMLVGLTTTALVLLIGFSQLIVGGHYVSDVLGGYAAGLVWLVLTITGVEMARRRRQNVTAAGVVSAPNTVRRKIF
jgi:membrane-associated phospholipid phosphatase